MTPPALTPRDFATLAAFVYGPAFYGPMSDDSGIRSENLRRIVDGKRSAPPALVEFLLRRTSDRWLLRGWADQAPPAGLSAGTAAELDARIGAARSWGNADRPPAPATASEEP